MIATTDHSRLMLSRGTRRVTFDQLQTIPSPPPTETWQPVSHGRVLASALAAIKANGYQVGRMDLGVSRDDARFFGVLDLTSTIVEGVTLAVGVRNSIDKSLPAGLAVGDRVLVCDNLAFSAQIVVMRKHTSRILMELDGKMAGAIGRLGAFQEQAAARIRLLQGTSVTDEQVHDLVIRAVDAKAIGWRDAPKVLQAWRQPLHVEFEPRTAWSLANAFTETAKQRFQRNPTMASAGTIRLNRLLERALPN
jgi:hypothetical protein